MVHLLSELSRKLANIFSTPKPHTNNALLAFMSDVTRKVLIYFRSGQNAMAQALP